MSIADTIGPAAVLARLYDVIERGTELRVLLEERAPRDGKAPPGADLHRHFMILPPRAPISGRGGPGGELRIELDTKIVLFHAIDLEARTASFERASADWLALLGCVASSAELAELVEAEPKEVSLRIVRDRIEHEQRFVLHFDVTLPEG